MEHGNSNFEHRVKNVSSLFSAIDTSSGSACANSTHSNACVLPPRGVGYAPRSYWQPRKCMLWGNATVGFDLERGTA